MRRTMGSAVVLVALAAVGALEAAAQQAPRAASEGLRGPPVETIMSMSDELELTEGQLADLDELRRDAVARRADDMAEMMEMRSRLEAGQARRSEMMALMEERRDAMEAVVEDGRARLEAILTEEQLQAVADLTRRRRDIARRDRFRGGRRGDFRGPRRGPRGAAWGARDARGDAREAIDDIREARSDLREARRDFVLARREAIVEARRLRGGN